MPRAPWLTRTVLVLGLVSLFTDVSSEMIFPLLPIFLTEVLRAPVTFLGLIEGAGDATAAVFKLVGGRLADRAPRKKPLALLGYTLSSVVRPLMAFAAAPWHVLAVRTTDRIGKGLRTSPRDAILAESVGQDTRAAGFGFHRAMDHAGAMLGGLLASALVAGGMELRTIFLWAAVPGALAVLALWLFMSERGETRRHALEPREIRIASPKLSPLPTAMVSYAWIKVLMAAGGRADALLLLRAREVGAPAAVLPMIWVGLHVVRSASAVPGGLLAGRIGNRRATALGWLVAGASWALLGQSTSLLAVGAATALFGLYAGLSEGAERALVADLAPPESRGRAFGVFYLADGLTSLPAFALTGWLWENHGAAAATLWGALTAALASALVARRSQGTA